MIMIKVLLDNLVDESIGIGAMSRSIMRECQVTHCGISINIHGGLFPFPALERNYSHCSHARMSVTHRDTLYRPSPITSKI